jgi:parallel beta-helix repeat protein
MNSLENFPSRVVALAQQPEHLQHQTQALEAHTQMVERRRRAVRALLLPVATLLGAIGIALGSVTPAHADVIQCGDVLGPGGRFELEHDLECDFRAVTVRDGAILDLNGHIVTCPLGFRCIVLAGTGAQLLNGAVQGSGGHEHIVLEGTGGHTVRNVTSTTVDHNIFVVQSDHNQLINVMASSVFNPAFNIAGNHNRLIDTIARCSGLFRGVGCITVSGHESRLINNFAITAGSGHGFLITGHTNVLSGNRAIGNAAGGIVVTGTGNRLSRNTALDNALDLQDTNGDCAHNTWGQNTFKTSDPACIQDSQPQARDVVQSR